MKRRMKNERQQKGEKRGRIKETDE